MNNCLNQIAIDGENPNGALSGHIHKMYFSINFDRNTTGELEILKT